jgi:hypothetical protein
MTSLAGSTRRWGHHRGPVSTSRTSCILGLLRCFCCSQCRRQRGTGGCVTPLLIIFIFQFIPVLIPNIQIYGPACRHIDAESSHIHHIIFVLVKAAVKIHYDQACALVVPICNDDEVEWAKRVVLVTKLEVVIANVAQLCAA